MTVGTGVALIVFLLASYLKGRLPHAVDIDPALHEAPLQTPTERKPFSFLYKGTRYLVRPRFDYEFTGLIVSHNNPQGFGDIYHDETSVDTRDFCVIWGDNVQTNEFRKVRYWSGAWTCWCSWKPGVTFRTDQLSNNHLITDSDAIRDVIAAANKGDQVYLSGMLVDYASARHPESWRRTSTNREDDGNGACEVVFVERIKILNRNNPTWHALSMVGLIGLITLPVGKAALSVMSISSRKRPSIREAAVEGERLRNV